MKYSKIVDDFYKKVNKKYDDIWFDAQNAKKDDIEFSFDKDYKESRSFAKMHPRFAFLTIKLNQLAEQWDEVLLSSRDARAKGGEVVKPEHTFLFSPLHSSLVTPEAMLYCKNLPPDRRMIKIKINTKEKYALLCALHEMGHFIGYRKRADRLRLYFIPMITDAICEQLYEYACSSFLGVDLNSNVRMGLVYYTEKKYADHIRSFACSIISGIRNIHKCLFSEINNRYEQYSEDYLRECKISEDEMEKLEGNGARDAFFSCVEAILLVVLSDVLSNKVLIAKYSSEIVSEERDETVAEKYKPHIQKAFEQLEQDVNENKPFWFEEYEKRLEEPAADIFMIKMSGITPKEYISLITYQLQLMVVSDISYKDQLSSLLGQPENYVRFLSVCAAAGATKQDFLPLTDAFFKHFPIVNKRIQRIHLREQLWEMYCSALKLKNAPDGEDDFFDPTRYSFEYVSDLFSDHRYNSMVSKEKLLTKEIMDLWNRPFANLVAYCKLAFPKNRNRK